MWWKIWWEFHICVWTEIDFGNLIANVDEKLIFLNRREKFTELIKHRFFISTFSSLIECNVFKWKISIIFYKYFYLKFHHHQAYSNVSGMDLNFPSLKHILKYNFNNAKEDFWAAFAYWWCLCLLCVNRNLSTAEFNSLM